MKINKKSILDEFQEQRLLKIESFGFWVAFYGLTAVILLQFVIYGGRGGLMLQSIVGESVILACISIYIIVMCIKNGLWDRRLKPTLKTNIVLSLISGAGSAAVLFFALYLNYNKLKGALIVALVGGFLCGVLSFGALSLSVAIYKKRLNKLENESE